MRVGDRPYRSIEWREGVIEIIDQTCLPFEFRLRRLETLADVRKAIVEMQVRGAPLIGVTAAMGVALHLRQHARPQALDEAYAFLVDARPTAVNLRWALDRMRSALIVLPFTQRAEAARVLAQDMADEDVAVNQQIGQIGLGLIEALVIEPEYANRVRLRSKRSGDTCDHPGTVRSSPQIHVLTHCNAGWLATVDHGTALAPLYAAHSRGLAVHVWVDETRPRNQGASLTAWELSQFGIPNTVISDNAGGLLMQQGLVDAVIVGCDRVTRNGDVVNKIGTYLKALAAHDNRIPFWVCCPSSTFDPSLAKGDDVEIENRSADELRVMLGQAGERFELFPETFQALNPAFDVTPARLVESIITEYGAFRPQALAQGLEARCRSDRKAVPK